MKGALTYKSYCWNFGTTSFRTKDFNKSIEEQLSLLDEFWHFPENDGKVWAGNDDLRIRYYDFINEKGFISGQAENKAKDARQKTSGLCDLGLIDEERRLTAAGEALLKICRANDFQSDNFLQIPKDSYIYLKQLLKTSSRLEDGVVRPFVLLLELLSKLEYLTLEEFTYILPLCIDRESTERLLREIPRLRNGEITADTVIVNHLMSFQNYKDGLDMFLQSPVDGELICTIGMNRKSRGYDLPYFTLYEKLHKVFVDKDMDSLHEVYSATGDVRIGYLWRGLLFDTVSKEAIKNSPEEHLKPNPFSDVSDENGFRETFYKTLHLLKAKSMLDDYMDLNRRYVKTSDIFLFEEGTVRLDLVPKHFFGKHIDEIYEHAFEESEFLFEDCGLADIFPCLVGDEQSIIEGINEEMGTSITTMDEARDLVERERYRRFIHLIDTKFTRENLLKLLGLFEGRKDGEIKTMVTENADVPTIFEYVLAIIWYNVSGRRGRILDYMKLSLDADLLPKSHANGGEADIVYQYEETADYPAHELLLEATLAEETNQRRMEMEPVSRHLGQHLLNTGNLNSYCVFVTTSLNINVISDFRARKYIPYYNPQNYDRYVGGMKIIPLNTAELKTIVEKGTQYGRLYEIFTVAFASPLPPHEWYDRCISQQL